MADIEAKLNMSLDDLAKKDRPKPPPQHQQQDGGQRGWHGPDRSHSSNWGGGGHAGRGGGRSGPQPQRGQFQGFRNNPQAAAALQYVQQEQWGAQPQRQPQQQAWGGPQMPPQAQQQPWGAMQQQPQQQQRWSGPGGRGPGGRGPGGPPGGASWDPSRPSVFARLSGAGPGPGPAGGRPQQQHQQPPPPAVPQQAAGPPRKAPKVSCRVDHDSGDVVMSHAGADIVRVGKSGDVVLDSCGRPTQETLDAFNCVLSHLAMGVKPAPGQAADSGQWSVSDGKRLLRFADGMKIPSRGPLTAGRAMVLMQAYAAGPSKAAAAAAEEASKQAAIAAGLLPADAAGADGVPADEAARLRRLKTQGRFQPY